MWLPQRVSCIVPAAILAARIRRRDEMKILVTGATGNVGGELVKILHQRGAEVRALARNPQAAKFAAGVEVVAGDMTNPESIREAVKGIDKLFLLNGVAADELT